MNQSETVNALKLMKMNIERTRRDLDIQLNSIQQQIDRLLPTEKRADSQEIDAWFADALKQATKEAR